MAEWRALTDEEIVELATRLRSLQWSWRLDDAGTVAAEFGWEVVLAEPNWVMLDVGLGVDTGRFVGWEGQADYITVQVTGGARDQSPERAQTRDAFARMAAALTAAFGEPTTRKPGKSAEVRWAGAETTVMLQFSGVVVELSLVTNAKQALRDQAVELEEQGTN
ncbi:hypothetical protein F5X71_04670 [Nocardia brasiliensis]|uniref:Uncharacterized protein n=1 Tax=Nocardia brasiliensis TaxID=37326 RepID=A0A6G9XLA9_NOCBR|nr:DUF6301 family protein [Nocardia brasiliensis]QIS01697.1 hypothetical protein F5X71_04670 [Nocardia brasiliensis]